MKCLRRTLLAAALPLPAAAEFRVEITGVGATQMPIAIPAFQGEAGAPQPVSEIVRKNLARSGRFRLVDGAGGELSELSSPVWTDWRAKAADALVGGSLTRLADGRWDLRFRLWDVVAGRELMGASHSVVADDLRLAAHRVADAIYEKLTGEKGVFATRLAYITKAGPRFTLWVSDADGEARKEAVTSTEPLISPAWSPDGRSLAYVSFHTGKAVVYTQDLQTGARRTLANFRGTNSAPAFAPDGARLALSLSRDGGTQLFSIGRDGGSLKRLTQTLAIDTEPCYTPDGRQIYFVSDRGGGPQIYRMPVEGGSAERVSFNGPYNVSPSISPDGRSLVFISRQGGAFRVALMDLASGNVNLISDTEHDESPSFAPNGRLIVYATRAGGRDVLMTSTLDGKVKASLVITAADVREPAWGPYGR
jgi:TolB protein